MEMLEIIKQKIAPLNIHLIADYLKPKSQAKSFPNIIPLLITKK